jgi:P4 family phage/plasmid primase-like protien
MKNKKMGANGSAKSVKGSESDNYPTVERLVSIFGEVVLLPVRSGTKIPIVSEWQKTTVEKMSDPAYLALLEQGSIGVLCGRNSGGVISIDADSDGFLDDLLKLNPDFAHTTLTVGAKGGNYWLKMTEDEYPPIRKLTDCEDQALGEFRSNGGCTVVYGRHPSVCNYRFEQELPPIPLAFGEIRWPERTMAPWIKNPLDDLIEREGEPFEFGSRGACRPQESFFASVFAKENRVLWCREEQKFYAYDESRGIWSIETEERIRERVLKRIQKASEGQDSDIGKKIKAAPKMSIVRPIVEMLKGRIERQDAFQSNCRLLHAKNGVVRLKDGVVELLPHSHEHMLRNEHDFAYDAERRIPLEFIEFLELNLTVDDILLLQKVFGSILFGGNPCQKILLLLTASGSGKGVLINVLRLIVGKENTVELRTQHLGGRFETARFVGKKLLLGLDVDDEFLRRKEASYLKSLVGHDPLSAEAKHGTGSLNLKGDFGIVVTSNHELRINAGDDLNAWMRRLLVLRFDKPFTGEKIPNLAEKLVKDEGDAIFSWAIQGRVLLEKDIREGGMVLSDDQTVAVQRVVDDSESLRLFVETRIERVEGGAFGQLCSKEIVAAYDAYCRRKGFKVHPDTVTYKKLPKLMEEVHKASSSNSVGSGDEGECRGYRGIALREEYHGS